MASSAPCSVLIPTDASPPESGKSIPIFTTCPGGAGLGAAVTAVVVVVVFFEVEALFAPEHAVSRNIANAAEIRISDFGYLRVPELLPARRSSNADFAFHLAADLVLRFAQFVVGLESQPQFRRSVKITGQA